MISKFSESIALKLNSYVKVEDQNSYEKIKYSLEIIIGEFSKLIILIAIFYFTDSLKEFIVSFLIFSLIKPFSGGIHFSTYGKCLGFSIAFFISEIILTKNMILLSNLFYVPIFIVLISLIYFYSPAKSKYRKFHTDAVRKKMKCITGVLAVVISLFSIISNSLLVINSSIFTILLITLQLIFLDERRFF